MSLESASGQESGGDLSQTDKLPKKRFELGKQEFARERIEVIKNSVDEIRAQNQEVLSLTLFGSTVKGNMTEASDTDGYLFVDADLAAEKYGTPVYDWEKKDGYKAKMSEPYLSDYKEIVSDSFEETGHITILPINQDIIDKEITAVTENRDWPPRQNLTAMFHLMVGRGIDKYRKYLIEKLDQMGYEGQECWSRIIEETEAWEEGKSKGLDKKRYPRTLEEAKALSKLQKNEDSQKLKDYLK